MTISGTRFLLDSKAFPYTGISFFNAIYNPAFNRSSGDRVVWLRKFQKYGAPDPQFNAYHRTVLEFIALRDRYAPELGK